MLTCGCGIWKLYVLIEILCSASTTVFFRDGLPLTLPFQLVRLLIGVLSITDEVLDMLLDQEGLEVDPIDRLEADTPLHKAVRFCNGLSQDEWESGTAVVELLIDAGADPRYVYIFTPCSTYPYRPRLGYATQFAMLIKRLTCARSVRNKAKLKSFELVDPRNKELRSVLQKAEFALMAGNDVVDREDEADGAGAGSASDSD